MLLILIFLLLLLWFFNQEVEGLDEGVEGDEDIIEEGLSIAEMNQQLQGTPQQPGSEFIITDSRVSILEQLSDRQTNQLSDLVSIITTIKTQKLANKPDVKLSL